MTIQRLKKEKLKASILIIVGRDNNDNYVINDNSI